MLEEWTNNKEIPEKQKNTKINKKEINMKKQLTLEAMKRNNTWYIL